MVNIRASPPTPEGTRGSGDVDSLEEMRATMYELCCYNQTFEDDIHIIRQLREDPNLLEEMEFLDP